MDVGLPVFLGGIVLAGVFIYACYWVVRLAVRHELERENRLQDVPKIGSLSNSVDEEIQEGIKQLIVA